MSAEEIAQLKTCRQIAAWLAAHPELQLRAEVSPHKANTDTPIGRLRWPGKGRNGSRIKIYSTHKDGPRETWGPPAPLLDHKNSETYRSLDEVRRWLTSWVRTPARSRLKKAIESGRFW